MNPYRAEKERWTSVPILYQIMLQNVPYMDFNLLVLTSFEVTTMITMDSQEPACCYSSQLAWILKEVDASMQLPYKACFGAPYSTEDGTN